MGWTFVGLTVQVAGVGLALFGMLQTWQRHGGSILSFLAPWLPGAWRSLRRWAAVHLLRRPRPKGLIVEEKDEVATGRTATSLREGMPAGPPERQIEWLNDQLQELRETVGHETVRHSRWYGRLVTRSTKLQDDIRAEAIGGLRQEGLGLLLVTVGTFISTVPNL